MTGRDKFVLSIRVCTPSRSVMRILNFSSPHPFRARSVQYGVSPKLRSPDKIRTGELEHEIPQPSRVIRTRQRPKTSHIPQGQPFLNLRGLPTSLHAVAELTCTSNHGVHHHILLLLWRRRPPVSPTRLGLTITRSNRPAIESICRSIMGRVHPLSLEVSQILNPSLVLTLRTLIHPKVPLPLGPTRLTRWLIRAGHALRQVWMAIMTGAHVRGGPSSRGGC